MITALLIRNDKLMFDFSFDVQVAEEIWICENQKVTKWEGDILAYKEMLKKKVMKDNEKRKKMF